MTLTHRQPKSKSSHGRREAIKAKRSNEFSRTLLIVVPLTLLIWVYAERAQNRDDTLTTMLSISASDSSLAVDSLDAGDGRVAVTVNGPRGQIDALKSRIESDTTVDGKLRVTLPAAESTLGEKSVDFTRLLNDTPLFANSGVTVIKTTPAQARMSVEQTINRDVTVVVPPDPGVTLQTYSFNPPKVTVRGPTSAINNEFGGDNPTIVADLSGLRDAAVGGSSKVDVPLVSPKDRRITLNNNRVSMTFEVGSNIDKVNVPSASILIERPLGDDGKSKVIIRRGPVVNNVQLRGPVNVVNKYVDERSGVKLQAVLQVSQDDIGKGPQSKRLIFPYLEAGVKEVGGPYDVTFEVVPVTSDIDR